VFFVYPGYIHFSCCAFGIHSFPGHHSLFTYLGYTGKASGYTRPNITKLARALVVPPSILFPMKLNCPVPRSFTTLNLNALTSCEVQLITFRRMTSCLARPGSLEGHPQQKLLNISHAVRTCTLTSLFTKIIASSANATTFMRTPNTFAPFVYTT
jgi:hypothetical protein